LAAVGVALSAFNIVTKISNIPLLAVTTSLVATARGVNGAGAALNSQTLKIPKPRGKNMAKTKINAKIIEAGAKAETN
jgi:hypothetical protein